MPSCNRCDRYFSSWQAYHQHVANSSNHNLCGNCELDFPTWIGLKEHFVQSPRHDYCQYCDAHFDDDKELEHHYQTSHSFCSQCWKVFENEIGLQEHYRQSERHHYCPPCDKLFLSASNLNSHLNSAIHRPKDVRCPFRCGGQFVSRSALVLHLENGACSSGVDRATVNKYVRQYDTNNVITDPARLLAGGSGSANQDIRYYATAASWNGSGYECCLCHLVYRSLPALNQHLGSPKHQDKIYLCRGPSCGLRFTTLSALVQHIESEKCGVAKFKAVQNAMNGMLGQMGRLTM
ncbi:hypothetical protein BDZ97DRAFT_1693153 [Flammula alnicola]|nr:hypothetical protein BDZ97DRAFT_1693153 [Flammula alnicola]